MQTSINHAGLASSHKLKENANLDSRKINTPGHALHKAQFKDVVGHCAAGNPPRSVIGIRLDGPEGLRPKVISSIDNTSVRVEHAIVDHILDGTRPDGDLHSSLSQSPLPPTPLKRSRSSSSCSSPLVNPWSPSPSQDYARLSIDIFSSLDSISSLAHASEFGSLDLDLPFLDDTLITIDDSPAVSVLLRGNSLSPPGGVGLGLCLIAPDFSATRVLTRTPPSTSTPGPRSPKGYRSTIYKAIQKSVPSPELERESREMPIAVEDGVFLDGVMSSRAVRSPSSVTWKKTTRGSKDAKDERSVTAPTISSALKATVKSPSPSGRRVWRA